MAQTSSRSRSRCCARRSSEVTSISATPTGRAAARTMFDHPKAGVSMNHSSSAYSMACGRSSSRKSAPAPIASVCIAAWVEGERFEISAVSRMCCPRCNAITAPSMASQRNRMEASSSDQMMGWWKTKRATTPARRMPISASTISAAGTATRWHSRRSARGNRPAAIPVSGGAAAPTGGASAMELMPAPPPHPPGSSRRRRRTCPSTRHRSRPCAARRGRPPDRCR